MIVSPRAKEITDIVRIAGEHIIEIDEVFLYRRAGDDGSYIKEPIWDRDEDNTIVDDDRSCRCVHTPCIILAEADYDTTNLTFNHTVRVLDGEGKPTGNTILLDHIIEMEVNQ